VPVFRSICGGRTEGQDRRGRPVETGAPDVQVVTAFRPYSSAGQAVAMVAMADLAALEEWAAPAAGVATAERWS
jgi:hypothetical protein